MKVFNDDPEFIRFFMNAHSLEEIQYAYEQFAASKRKPMTFDEWWAELPKNKAIMTIVRKIYEFDETARMNNEQVYLNIRVSKRVPRDKTKQRKDPITDEEIISFYNNYKK